MSDQSPFGEELAQSILRLDQGDTAGAMRLAKAAYLLAEQRGDSEALARSMSHMAWCCMRLGDIEAGLECAVAARRLWSRRDDSAELARIQAIEAFLLPRYGAQRRRF